MNIIIFIIAGVTVFQTSNMVDMYFQAKVMGKYIAYANALSLFVGSVFEDLSNTIPSSANIFCLGCCF